MAEVLLGRSDGIEGFERHVVLKRIRPEHARDQRFISMFLDEARLAAGLHHQAIVQVFDIGESNGEYFFAMEYIHGEDLRKLLASVWKSKTHVPLGHVCAIVSAVASGLHYAHERRDSRGRALNIVHRDVSPSNVLVGYDGAVKVLDFGIAKAAVRQAETAVRSLKGKTSYMSPEQCKGAEVDRRSDVYGLGVLLYELATTSRLFKGENEYLVMDAIVNGKFAMPRVRRPDLPNELNAIIMRALASDPARRYQTADELRVDLDQFASNNDLTASTSALSSYMRKLFGERPEPWLEGDDAEISILEAGASWSDGQSEDMPRRLSDNAIGRATTRASRNSLANISPSVVVASETAQRTSPYDTTAPSMKFGWEARPVQSARTNKLLWASVPALALIAFGLWKFGLSSHHDPAPAAATATPATAPAAPPTVTPVPAPAPAAAPVAVATTEPAAPTLPARVVAAPEPAHVDAEPAKKTTKAAKADPAPKKAEPAKPEQVAVAAPAKPAPVETKPVAAPAVVAPPAAPAPVPAAAPAPPPAAPAITAAPAPAPEPRIVDAPIATLSNATVSAIASDHSKQLSSCEGTATLHGDVSVTFQIDGSGKVVKSQLASTIKNPKAAACILKAVLSWKFPKPPTGQAKGVYSISYQ